MDLSLLVNAYDDGLSTGELREFIPSMLGPSDFRKNLSQMLDFCSGQQYAVQKILELRLPNEFTADDFDRLVGCLANGTRHWVLPAFRSSFKNWIHLDGPASSRFCNASPSIFIRSRAASCLFPTVRSAT